MSTPPLDLEFATEAELYAIAERGKDPERSREAWRLLLARSQELALRAAADLRAGLDHVWPGWREASAEVRREHP